MEQRVAHPMHGDAVYEVNVCLPKQTNPARQRITVDTPPFDAFVDTATPRNRRAGRFELFDGTEPTSTTNEKITATDMRGLTSSGYVGSTPGTYALK